MSSKGQNGQRKKKNKNKNKKKGAAAAAKLHRASITTPVVPAPASRTRAPAARSDPQPTQAPIARFFALYAPSFIYRPGKSASSEWKRLRDYKGWHNKHDSVYKQAQYQYQLALVQQFDGEYGTDENDLNIWIRICRRLVGVKEIPDTLEEARALVKSTHVNLVDLTEAVDGRQVDTFPTEASLAEYTRDAEKYYPKRLAKTQGGGVLRYLLRQILMPRDEDDSPPTSLQPAGRKTYFTRKNGCWS